MSLLSFNQTDSKSKDKDAKVRPMAVAGSFYPIQKDSIKKLMDSYFASYTKTEPKEQIAAIIVPHDEKIIPTFKRIYHIRDGVTHVVCFTVSRNPGSATSG